MQITHRNDVTILGGGLAGLTLALQLKQSKPDLSVLVLERQSHPVSEAAHKVGESTVEVGAHYFAEILGLKQHLKEKQLPKFGLRFFFRESPEQTLYEGLEVGASDFFSTPSYQLDRGIFENYLAEHARDLGVEFISNSTVRSVALGVQSEHTVTFKHQGNEQVAVSKWVVDASGRAGLIKRQYDLVEEVSHKVNAYWFRLGAKIDIEDWYDNAVWKRNGNKESYRWLSTNHLMGRGYWVWLIPLSSGSTSIGIVADPALHPAKELSTFEKALEWLKRHEPKCAEVVENNQDKLQDFLKLRHFSHSCKQVFSADRWALTGEAGVFLDPFYSPGSDFIGISNTLITDMVMRDMAGDSLLAVSQIYEKLYLSLFRNSLQIYENQYPLFGNSKVMSVKVVWDYAVYWGIIAFLFFNQKLTNISVIGKVREELQRLEELNKNMQLFLLDWDEIERSPVANSYVDHRAIELLAGLNAKLQERYDDDAFVTEFNLHMQMLDDLSAEIISRACMRHAMLGENAAYLTEQPAAPSEKQLDNLFSILNI